MRKDFTKVEFYCINETLYPPPHLHKSHSQDIHAVLVYIQKSVEGYTLNCQSSVSSNGDSTVIIF